MRARPPDRPPMRPEDLQTPTLLVHLDRVRRNLAAMTRWLDGRLERWRPHVKTSKIPEVLALVARAGVRRFKCATTREADVLLEAAGAATGDEPLDVLFAMAQHGPVLDRVTSLARAHPRHRFSL